jgi:hypothetical protein
MADPMAQAAHDGIKTQMRVPVKPQPVSPGPGAYLDAYNGGPQWNWWAPDNRQYLTQILHCPFGKPGGLLYLKEAWATVPSKSGAVRVRYRAERGSRAGACIKWRPSTNMRKEHSRTWLRVKRVWAERVQGISEEDARAEGVAAVSLADVPRQAAWDERQDFAALWDSIYKSKGLGWDANPWVWGCEFERTEKP